MSLATSQYCSGLSVGSLIFLAALADVICGMCIAYSKCNGMVCRDPLLGHSLSGDVVLYLAPSTKLSVFSFIYFQVSICSCII